MNVRHRRGTAVGASVVLAGALAVAGSPAAAAGPHDGGTLVYALPSQTNINWYFPLADAQNNSLYNFQLINLLYKPLIWIGNNYQPDWASSVADKVTWNPQGTVYHVYLNRKWHWSDGQPVTSADILFTWNVIKAASATNAPAPWPYVGAGSGDIPSGVASIVANGPYEVTITLAKPANQEWFEYNGINQLVPMPAHAWDKYGTNWQQEIKYLGSEATNPKFDTPVDGPYELAQAVANQKWVLVPNPHYDGHKSYVSRFIFQYEASDSAEFAALKTGTVQVGYIPFGLYPVRNQLASVDVIRPLYGFAFNQLIVNMTHNAMDGVNKIFDHTYVRQALQMATDQEGILQHFYYGQGVVGTGPIPIKPATVFLDPRLRHQLFPFNLKRAQALLEAHGWHLKNGVMTNGSEQMKFQLVYSSGDTATTDSMELIQHDWAQIGVDVQLEPMPFATMLSLPNQKWEIMGGIGWIYGGSYPTGYSLYDSQGGTNATVGYDSPEADHLIALTHEPWPNQKINLEHFYAYEYYIAEQCPNLWMPNTPTFQVNEKDVHNSFRYTNGLTGAFQPQYWWIAP
jgi:peptide/nickel transport system substrate-binding protein